MQVSVYPALINVLYRETGSKSAIKICTQGQNIYVMQLYKSVITDLFNEGFSSYSSLVVPNL